jgi:serine/threonine protein phosphatase PrpC
MNTFQEKIESWLSRTVPDRAVNQCFDLPAVLATDIGLQRNENQDRVAALRINTKSAGGRPLIAVAVVDGMGGMRDGAKCATLALSSFFYALTLYRSHEIERRAHSAIAHANDAVFRFAGGKGGATLAAVLLDHELRPFVVHLGDSRIYSFGPGAKLERLTTDDSLAEAVGGHGRDLLQFVGMGEGMQPHVKPVPVSGQQLAITTDGIHFIESATLESVLFHAAGLKPASERLAALARWCGGPDNASSALVDLQSLMQEIRNGADNGIQLWDPFGSLTAMWIRAEAQPVEDKLADAVVHENAGTTTPEVPEQRNPRPEHSRRKPPSKKAKRNKKHGTPKEDIQLEIQIERSADPEEPDENSR